MHIGFVPFFTKSYNDVVWVDDTMRNVLKHLRLNARMPKSQIGVCHQCRGYAPLEWHHVRPLWSVATEIVLRFHPLQYSDMTKVNRYIFESRFKTETAHVHNELLPLCRQCHDTETAASNPLWKVELSKKFPILWSYRCTLESLCNLAHEWYWEPAFA